MDEPWEYRVEVVLQADRANLASDLNRLGAEGWELVTVAPTIKKIAAVGNEFVCIFKRPGLGEFKAAQSGWG